MIAYFGRDEQGFFADSEQGVREYVSEELWRLLIQAGAQAGADVQGADRPNGNRVKLSITEQIQVEKFEGDALIETVHGTPQTTTL